MKSLIHHRGCIVDRIRRLEIRLWQIMHFFMLELVSIGGAEPVLQMSQGGHRRIPWVGTIKWGAHHLIIWMNKENNGLSSRLSSKLLFGNNHAVPGRREPARSKVFKQVSNVDKD